MNSFPCKDKFLILSNKVRLKTCFKNHEWKDINALKE